MRMLSIAIKNAGMTMQKFADLSQIPYYRIALILYGHDFLSKEEQYKIKKAFGDNIFLPSTTQNV